MSDQPVGERTAISPDAILAAVRAGMKAILEQGSPQASVAYKDDASPVTRADRAAEEAILEVLQAATDLPIVAEERFAAGDVPEAAGRFLLVDPLDGTKSYIAGTPDYTVNVALIEEGEPVYGCVGVPATGDVYYGGRNRGATLERGGETVPLGTRRADPRTVDVVASRSHLTEETRAYLSGIETGEFKSIGSSLKFCLLAEGLADLYPRFGRTMQWDTAAGDAVLRGAGGTTIMVDGTSLLYGRHASSQGDSYANSYFIALGDLALLDRPGIVPRKADRQ